VCLYVLLSTTLMQILKKHCEAVVSCVGKRSHLRLLRKKNRRRRSLTQERSYSLFYLSDFDPLRGIGYHQN
jgi:hypothetical protein